jgi:hypothetical protein
MSRGKEPEGKPGAAHDALHSVWTIQKHAGNVSRVRVRYRCGLDVETHEQHCDVALGFEISDDGAIHASEDLPDIHSQRRIRAHVRPRQAMISAASKP